MNWQFWFGWFLLFLGGVSAIIQGESFSIGLIDEVRGTEEGDIEDENRNS